MFIFILIFIWFFINTNNLTNPRPKSTPKFVTNLYNTKSAEMSEIKFPKFQFRNYCEQIHIGIVTSGSNSNVHFHALLKSLFLTRSNPIHFHLVVDDESEHVLKLLFDTWQIPQVNATFYNIKNWLHEVKWVPNHHYSGNYGLLKLVFPKIIKANITKKLLILDTDLIIYGDLYLLWKVFDEFNNKQAIGIVENQSEYYLGKLGKSRPWPALEKGFNSGVMLYDLEKLNDLNWQSLWINLTKRLSLIYGDTSLGDQDIINAFFVEMPEILYKLPCFWNTQMSDYSLSSNCYSKYKPMIVHWNSPKKYDVLTKDGEKFKGLANGIFELNGNLFRRWPQLCENKNQIVPKPMATSYCGKLNKKPNEYYRTFLFFREYNYFSMDYDVTYVTHLSYDRYYLIEEIANSWTGPISFTFYTSDAELMKLIHFISNSESLKDRKNIMYHGVFQDGDIYPINILRNIGLNNVNTPFVFLVDIDFIPMKNLYEILKDNIKSMGGDLNKKALIVPAFEAKNANIKKIPTNKIELIDSLDNNEIRPFLSEYWTAGHGPTNYDKWRNEFEPYRVKWKVDYEPYVVVKNSVVKYDERFLGFGWNRVSHIMELEANDYEFIVLSDVFIIHVAHRISWDNMNYRKSPNYRLCLQLLKKRFVVDLQEKYNKTYKDIIFSDSIPDNNNNRIRREALISDSTVTTTTSVYDSTDYFLVWGGKDIVERKKEYRLNFDKKPSVDFDLPKHFKEHDYYYYYYESEYPYNKRAINLKNYTTGGNTEIEKNSSLSEEHVEYEYDEDDLKFKNIHDSTTITYLNNATFLADGDLSNEKINDNNNNHNINESFKMAF